MSAVSCKSLCIKTEEAKNIENIVESTNYLLSMVTKIQHNLREIELKKEVILLNDLVQQILKLNRSLIEEKNIAFNVSISDTNISYPLDVIHITETINNIVKNSIEAMVEGGIIDLRISETKRILTITISDNGSGISKENLLHIKDPFFTTKKRSLNFGLGLSYCYNVMEQHNGELLIKSDIGKGTTVFLNFPKASVMFYKLLHFMNP